MKRILLIIAIIICGTLTVSAQYNESYNPNAGKELSLSMVSPGYSSGMDYSSSAKWKTGNGLMIAGLSTLGAGVLTFGGCLIYIAADEELSFEDFVKNSLFATYFVAVTVPVGVALSIVGGCLRASAKNDFTSYRFDVGDRGSFAQLGVTDSGNFGFSITF
jgi:hypothetical protein